MHVRDMSGSVSAQNWDRRMLETRMTWIGRRRNRQCRPRVSLPRSTDTAKEEKSINGQLKTPQRTNFLLSSCKPELTFLSRCSVLGIDILSLVGYSGLELSELRFRVTTENYQIKQTAKIRSRHHPGNKTKLDRPKLMAA